MGKAVGKTAAHKAAMEGKPIKKHGLQLWGMTMRQYEEWAKYKNVWLARQSTFPVFCISMSFLDALFALDMDAIDKAGKPMGYVNAVLNGLRLALRLDEDCVRDGDIALSVNEAEHKLNAIVIKPKGSEEPALITPAKFGEIRKIVAWMQGEEVPDESMNDELLETARDLAERNAPNLKYDLNDLEAAVAINCGVRVRDILDWPIVEFEAVRRAIDRNKKHLICGIGATNGCKWDGGNPYPSWCFDREDGGTNALIAASEFGKAKANKKE